MKPVTDPALLAALEAGGPPAGGAVTDPALLAQLNAAVPIGILEDVARAGGSGLLRGVAHGVGTGGDISKGIEALNPKLEKAGMPVQESRQEMLSAMPAWLRRYFETPTTTIGSKEVAGAIDTATGAPVTQYEAKTLPGKITGTAAEFVGNPLSYMAPGTLPYKVAMAGLAGTGSEVAGQATEGTKAEPYARVAGALLAPFAPTAIGRAITPAPARAAHQRLVDILEGEGVTSLTAGQRTGNESLRYAESTLGNAPFTGQPANRIAREGQEQFTEAAMRRAGAGPDASPEVLATNQRRLGNEFKRLSASNTMQMDAQFANDVRGVIREYGRVLPSEQRERLFNIITDIGQHGNAVPGTVYQTTRSRLTRIANDNKAGQGDPEFGRAMAGLRDALDDAMGRSISPADRAAWQAARREYGAQKVIEKAASRAGEVTAEGQVTPANLRNTVAAENRGAYARGEGDFSELSRAGAGVMAPMPQSGTAPRSAFYNIANMLSAGVIPATIGRVLMSRPVQGYLSNQAVAGPLNRLNPRQAAVVNALLAAQQEVPPLNLRQP